MSQISFWQFRSSAADTLEWQFSSSGHLSPPENKSRLKNKNLNDNKSLNLHHEVAIKLSLENKQTNKEKTPPCWSAATVPSSETSIQRSRPQAGGSPPRSPSPSPGPASGPPQPAGSGWSERDSPQFSEVPVPVHRGSGEDEEEWSAFVNAWINHHAPTVTWPVSCGISISTNVLD